MASLILGKCHERSQPDKGEKSKSRGCKKGGAGGGGVLGERWPVSAARPGEKKQGPEHKASQIDLSLHEEERAKRLHYHAHHTL